MVLVPATLQCACSKNATAWELLFWGRQISPSSNVQWVSNVQNQGLVNMLTHRTKYTQHTKQTQSHDLLMCV